MPATEELVDHTTGARAGSQDTDDATRKTTEDVDRTEHTSQQTDGDAGASDDTAPEEVKAGLITQEQYDTVKDDPAALRKGLLKGFTKATQRASAERKNLGAWAEIRDAFDEDPASALKALASHFGLDVRDTTAAGKTAETTTTVTDAGDAAVTELKAMLKDAGLEELGEKLAPVLRKIAETAAGKVAEPLRSTQDRLLDDSAQRESAAVMEAFGKVHPDWKEFEPKMVELSKQFRPATDDTGNALINERDYVEHLYFLASKDVQVKRGVTEAVKRMTTTAARDGATERRGVSDAKVTTKPTGKVGFTQAYEAAKRGEVWTD